MIMTPKIRRQLTLFTGYQAPIIEAIRAEFNPVQFNLIPTHITLCRENEIEHLEMVIANIRSIQARKPIKIQFDRVETFADGKGVWMPAKIDNPEFETLRAAVLKGLDHVPCGYRAHLTLMHPRNSSCTDKIFERLQKFKLPAELYFDKISLIEQCNGNKWSVIEEF
jgi:2'-5' RNA ligase